jgi:hypothetical protein
MANKMERLRRYYDTADTSDSLEKATLEQPDTAAEPMVTYALRLPKPVLDGLRTVADEQGIRVTALMRVWLEERLGRESGGKDKVISVDDLLALVAERSRQTGKGAA